MSNFRLTMPSYLVSSFNQLTQDHNFTRQDLATLKQAAASQQGSRVQEALETQTLDTLEQKLTADRDGSLRLDAIQVDPQSMNVGHAIFELSLLPDVPAEPSQAEQDWASQLELKLQQKYTPNQSELTRYQDICERYLASRQGQPAPTTQELEWANGIQRQAQAGQQPASQDMARFRDIVARQALHVRNLVACQPEPTKPPSNDDLRWAAELQDKVQNKGYLPSDSEQVRFQQIGRALAKFSQAAPGTEPVTAPVTQTARSRKK